MAVNFQDGDEKVARNPNNYNILKGGKVDPRSPLYQRSIAGREQLKDYLNRLWNEGGDEADVFMAGVKSLMNRGHGYVGAYLDSKNPGRRYTDNQAKAIVDQVMTDEGIGEHPGARLTRPKDKEGKEERKAAGAARGSGPQQAPGRKAMPVGQQRKLGKRESTGQPLEDSRREGIGEREKGPVSEWQKTLEDRMKGKASTQDVLAAFQKQYQSKLSRSPKAEEEKRKAKAEDRARETTAPEEAAAPEETGRIKADPVSISNKFKELVQDSVKANMPIDKNSLESMIQETIEILEDDFDVDPEEARGAILRRFNNKMIDGNRIVFDPSSAPDTAARKTAPEPGPAPEQPEPERAGPTKPVEGRIKQDLGTEFKSQYDTFRKGLIDSERRKSPGAWDQTKERYIQPDESQLRDLVDLSIDEIKERHGNIDESSARSQLREYLVDSLGIDPYEEEETPAPAKQGSAAPDEKPQPQQSTAGPSLPDKEIQGGFYDDFFNTEPRGKSKSAIAANVKGIIEDLADEYGVNPSDIYNSVSKNEENAKLLNEYGIGVDDFKGRATKKATQPQQAAPEEQPQESAPKEQAPPAPGGAAPSPNRATRRAQGQRGSGPRARKTKGTAPRGFGGVSKPSPEQIKAIKEKVAKVPKEQLIKEMEQGTLFPSGLVTETSQTNPLEGGSTGADAPDAEQPIEQRTPEETGGSLLDEEGAAKDFRKSGPEKPKPSAKKPTQRSIRGLGPSAGRFDTTRTQKAGDELLTQNLKSYGFTPKQVKDIQKSGLTEEERQTITRRRKEVQEEKAKQAPRVAEERGGGLLDGENQAKDFRKSGPQAPSKPTGGKKTRGPLDQFAKVVMSGIERDKAARESASQFLDRVSKLIRERAGRNVSKSDADQAAARAINQQKGRTTRNKTGKKGVSNSAEYQEFAQSIRAMMR